ncbi:hypothetical protein SAY87_028492 [Trapa incisa]|uniref:Exportin-T n=1 Tax=Trapa incisa TaxID=236973 RepID=A0AAN7KPD0_9MYRT|nr:hypothetical protein SAY87_028492 [Trapa incisa]
MVMRTMDPLVEAILISFDESGKVDLGLKAQAVAYCQQIRETPTICRICIEKLRFCMLPQVRFWCLQTLHEVVRVKYSLMGSEEKDYVRNSVLSISCSNDKIVGILGAEGPAFIKNKLAQVLVSFIYFEYPGIWSSVFLDFLQNLSRGTDVIDMFCRVMNVLDDELISLDYPRTPEEVAVAARVKDSMRQQCISQIARAWYDTVTLHRDSEPELCSLVLDTMSRYISWIDIRLVANDAFVPLLFDLILLEGLSEQLRCSAAACISAIVLKRMDPQSKLSLLESLQVGRVFGLITSDDPELVSGVGVLLKDYTTEVLDCLKRVTTEESRRETAKLLDEVLPSVFYIIQKCEADSGFSIVQLLSSYVATLKGVSSLNGKELHNMGHILEVIRSQICFDPAYRVNLDSMDKIGIDEEAQMADYRKDFLMLLRSVGRVAPDFTLVFIRNALVSAVSTSPDRNVEEVEAALSLFYAIGESQNEDLKRSEEGLLSELVPMLLSTKFPCHSHRLVALAYLDIVTRYIKFVQMNAQYIPMVLAVFLDERGIHHPNDNVSRRASYLFMRVVKLLKSSLVPFVETILQGLHDAVARFINTNYMSKAFTGSEDGSHIFEAIGMLIGMEDISMEKQSEYLSALLTPLCQQVASLFSTSKADIVDESVKLTIIQQIIMAINALSKGFNKRLVTARRPAIGHMFKKTLDVLLEVLVIYPKMEPIRNKVLSFVHRMVDTLGESVFSCLPKAFEQLLAENEPAEMARFLVLVNQLICKFSISVQDIIAEVFPVIVGRIFGMIPMDTVLSGPGTNTEEFRELQELQKSFYTFLHVITMHGLSSVFLSPKGIGFLDQLMQLLLHTSCNHNDPLVRKTCVQIFTRLIKDWCIGPREEKVPGFQKFVIETFATNCCLYSVLDKSFEFQDANTILLFGEIVLVQKVMYEKFGDDFLIHFVSRGFLYAHCPQNLAEQYCQKLQGSDIKALKSFYQSLIETLRLQQNGSLIFR